MNKFFEKEESPEFFSASKVLCNCRGCRTERSQTNIICAK